MKNPPQALTILYCKPIQDGRKWSFKTMVDFVCETWKRLENQDVRRLIYDSYGGSHHDRSWNHLIQSLGSFMVDMMDNPLWEIWSYFGMTRSIIY